MNASKTTVSAEDTPHFLLINGPPRSGKDTVGEIVEELFGCSLKTKFAKALKERTHALYGIKNLDHDAFEQWKDEPSERFLGLTPRQAYINVSETYFKSVHGDPIFGEILAEDIGDYFHDLDVTGQLTGTIIITDSGFEGEAKELMEQFPQALFTVVQVMRKGCTFEGDSRGYIEFPSGVAGRTYIANNGTLDELRVTVAEIIGQALNRTPDPRFESEVQLPGDGGEPMWFPIRKTDDRALLLAQVEALRQTQYKGRIIRLTDTYAEETTVEHIYPGDDPVYNLNEDAPPVAIFANDLGGEG